MKFRILIPDEGRVADGATAREVLEVIRRWGGDSASSDFRQWVERSSALLAVDGLDVPVPADPDEEALAENFLRTLARAGVVCEVN